MLPLCQFLGFLLQTVPVIILFWSAIPKEYVKIPHKECVKKCLFLILAADIVFVVFVCIIYRLRPMVRNYAIYNGYMLLFIIIIFVYVYKIVVMDWHQIIIVLLIVVQYEAIIVNLVTVLMRAYDILFIGQIYYVGATFYLQNVILQLCTNLVLFPLAYLMMVKTIRNNMYYIRGELAKKDVSIQSYQQLFSVLSVQYVWNFLI